LLKKTRDAGFNEALVRGPATHSTICSKPCYEQIVLCCFLLLSGAAALAQETTAAVWNKSNCIILHFTDTTGKFTQLARLFIDRGYDIDMKDRELGILRTKPSPLRGGHTFLDKLEIKTIFRDSTITFSGVTYSPGVGNDFTRFDDKYEVLYSKKWERNIMLSWEEMQTIAELLKPASITYSTVDVTDKALNTQNGPVYRRNN